MTPVLEGMAASPILLVQKLGIIRLLRERRQVDRGTPLPDLGAPAHIGEVFEFAKAGSTPQINPHCRYERVVPSNRLSRVGTIRQRRRWWTTAASATASQMNPHSCG